MDRELKPCPFFGSVARIVYSNGSYMARCSDIINCGANSGEWANSSGLEKHWNERSIENKLNGELAERYARVAELENICSAFEKMLQMERDRSERREVKLKAHIAILEAGK